MSDLAEVLPKNGWRTKCSKAAWVQLQALPHRVWHQTLPYMFYQWLAKWLPQGKSSKTIYIFQHVTPKRASPFWTAANKPVSKLGPSFAPKKKHEETSRSMWTNRAVTVQFSTQVASKQPTTCLTQGVTEESGIWRIGNTTICCNQGAPLFFLFIRNDVPPVVGPLWIPFSSFFQCCKGAGTGKLHGFPTHFQPDL